MLLGLAHAHRARRIEVNGPLISPHRLPTTAMPFGHPTSDGAAVARGKGRKRTASGSVSPEMIDHPAVSACAHINATMHTAPIHLHAHAATTLASVRVPECVLPTLACMSYTRVAAYGQRHHRSVQPTNCSLMLGFLVVESMRASSFYANSWRMLTLTCACFVLRALKLPPSLQDAN